MSNSEYNWPKISVITPSFNQGEYLEQTICSVLEQGYPNLEYIIIDGGSTDCSVEIIKKYEHSLTYWVSEEDRGQYHAINKGFSVSTGEVMLWINSDDLLVAGSLETIGSIFNQFRGMVQWITGVPAYADKNGMVCKVFNTFRYHRNLLRFGCYEGRAINWIMQECTAWTRDLWNSIGARLDENLNYAADFKLWCDFSQHAQLYWVSTVLGCNRQHTGQKTEITGNYYCEVDQIVRENALVYLANRLFRINIVKKLARTYFLATRNKKYLFYDFKSYQWKLED